MKFQHYYQLEAKDCGPTCLRMVARHYGKSYSLIQIKELCPPTRLGVSLKDIIAGAQRIGLETLCVQLSIQKIIEVPLPAILFWQQKHFVVLYKIRQTSKGLFFYISDPSFGKIILTLESFTSNWKGPANEGVALLLEPKDAFFVTNPVINKKNDTFLKIFRIFTEIIKSNRREALFSSFLILITMLCTWLFPIVFQKMIDHGVIAKNLHVIVLLLVTQLIIFISQIISDSINSLLLMKINFKMSITFLTKYLNKLIRLPIKIFDVKVNSDLLLRMEDSDRIQSFLTHHSLEFIFSFINLIVFSAILCYYNIYCFYIFLIISFLGVSWTIIFLNKRKILDYSRFSVSSEVHQNIYELITEMPEVKINNADKTKISQWEKLQSKLNKIKLQALFLNYYQLVGANFFTHIKDIFITGLCAYFVVYDKMTLGVMMAIGFVLGQLNTPINNFINTIRGLQDTELSFNRLEDIQLLDEESNGKSVILLEPPKKNILVKDVSFKYEGNESPYVLHNIYFEIPIAKITAIVGASGSGKTSLMKLLLGSYNPTLGNIFLDDIDLNTIQLDSWRDKCGVVLEDGYIYSGTYAENIALADEHPDLIKIKQAAHIACIDTFIESLALGYNTKIGKSGINLSGGQKQRILIARAIYRNPEFIFFDEATSNLDANNEKQIMKNLQNFFKGRTVVIIAHRLSTVKNTDQIIVLDNGKIIEQSNYETLVKSKGKYFELVKNQLELG